jgi:hypothetical protein
MVISSNGILVEFLCELTFKNFCLVDYLNEDILKAGSHKNLATILFSSSIFLF